MQNLLYYLCKAINPIRLRGLYDDTLAAVDFRAIDHAVAGQMRSDRNLFE